MNDSTDETLNQPLTHTLVVINGTIVSSKGFECHSSCICFYIESNKNWSFVNESNETSFYGSTQKCWTNDFDLSLFSTPFEIVMKLKNPIDWPELGPTLYLKVLSFDYQNRLISESYGLVGIAIRRGRHSLKVNTWKPYNANRLDQMKQFFIGCTPVVHNFHCDSTQINHKTVNSYGFQSETSGSVDIDLDLIIQTEKPILINRDKYKVNVSSVNSIKQNILSVVLAFQRARKRMDSIRNDLSETHLF